MGVSSGAGGVPGGYVTVPDRYTMVQVHSHEAEM